METPQYREEDLRQAAERLGPFDPPADFDHGEEFSSARPRPIPRELYRGSHWIGKRRTVRVLFIISVACLIGSQLPFIHDLSFYILPLQWLDWIGSGLLLITLIVWMKNQLHRSTFDYVRVGIASIGRILRVDLVDVGSNDLRAFKLILGVEVVDPDTADRRFLTFDAPTCANIENLTPDMVELEPGTYITVVSQEGQFLSTARVYRFLGLNPEKDFVADVRKAVGGGFLSGMAIACSLIGLFGTLIFGAYAIEFYAPLSGNWWRFLIPTSLGFAMAFVGMMLSNREEDSGSRYGGAAAVGLFGALLAAAFFTTLNGTLDQSPMELQPFKLVNFWETTHNGVIRDYKLEYNTFDIPAKNEKVAVTVQQAAQFDRTNLGAFDVGKGRFGFTWIRGIHPVVWVRVDDGGNTLTPRFSLTANDAEEVDAIEVAPAIALDDGRFVSLPESLLQPAIAELESKGADLRPLE